MRSARIIHKPSQSECYIIRQACADGAGHEGPNGLVIEAGERLNTEDEVVDPNINIALITKAEPLTREWYELGDDTDLHDHMSWKGFRDGFPLSYVGFGIVDFYVYTHDKGLITNVVAYFDKSGLYALSETSAGVVWIRGLSMEGFDFGPFFDDDVVEVLNSVVEQ